MTPALVMLLAGLAALVVGLIYGKKARDSSSDDTLMPKLFLGAAVVLLIGAIVLFGVRIGSADAG